MVFRRSPLFAGAFKLLAVVASEAAATPSKAAERLTTNEPLALTLEKIPDDKGLV